MTRIEELSECLVQKYGISRQQASQFAADFFALIRERLETEQLVKIKGLGTFKLAEISARESVDVNTGERITIDGRLKISFTPDNAVKNRINSPFAAFESIDMDDDGNVDVIQNLPEVTVTPSEPEAPEAPKEPEPKNLRTSGSQDLEDLVRKIYQEEKKKEEVKSVKIVENVEEEYDEEEQADSLRKKVNILSWFVGILIILLVAVIGLVGYQFYRPQLLSLISKPATVTVEKKAPVLKKTLVKKVHKSVAPSHVATTDPRVRTGAYIVLGIDKVVTSLKDQSVETLSKYYLGDDMSCYVEAVNNGKKEFKKGEKVNLPKLETKRHWRRHHKR